MAETNEKGEANVREYRVEERGRRLKANGQMCEIFLETQRLVKENKPGLCGVLQRVLLMLREVQ